MNKKAEEFPAFGKAEPKRELAQALALSVAPEKFYDVVMRAALDKDFRDFNQQGIECRVQAQHLHKEVHLKNGSSASSELNASFRLKLSPDSAKFFIKCPSPGICGSRGVLRNKFGRH